MCLYDVAGQSRPSHDTLEEEYAGQPLLGSAGQSGVKPDAQKDEYAGQSVLGSAGQSRPSHDTLEEEYSGQPTLGSDTPVEEYARQPVLGIDGQSGVTSDAQRDEYAGQSVLDSAGQSGPSHDTLGREYAGQPGLGSAGQSEVTSDTQKDDYAGQSVLDNAGQSGPSHDTLVEEYAGQLVLGSKGQSGATPDDQNQFSTSPDTLNQPDAAGDDEMVDQPGAAGSRSQDDQPGDAGVGDRDTHTVRLSPTITGAVARYVTLQLASNRLPILTVDDFQGGKVAQSANSNPKKKSLQMSSKEKGIQNQRKKNQKRMKSAELPDTGEESRARIELKLERSEDAESVLEKDGKSSRRLENLPGRQENPRRQEMVKKAWKRLRETKFLLEGKGWKWKELNKSDKKDIEKDGKKQRKDLVDMKRVKFGKAGNNKISNIEEAILASQTRKKIELEEMKLNVKSMMSNRSDVKDLPEGWKILRDGIAEVDEFECWISANRLKGTSIDDQRSLIRDEN